MKIRVSFLAYTLFGFLSAVFWQSTSLAAELKTSDTKRQAAIKRGEYLVGYGGCNDCHTPKIFTPQGPKTDPNKLLSGYPSGAKLPEIPQGIIGPDKWGALTNNDLTAWFGPWGVSFAQNLTPDMKTGLGNWTEAMFIKSMRTGKHLGDGRHILPPMPWFSIAVLTDKDLKAVFSYLRSIKPIVNEVPQHIPPTT